MLVLTRKIGQSIIANKDIKFTILGSQKGQVRIGIEAPENIEVHREEIIDRILSEESDSITKEMADD